MPFSAARLDAAFTASVSFGLAFITVSSTILTVLGVVVGCCSIVLMISIGQGINERNEQFAVPCGGDGLAADIVACFGDGYAAFQGGNAAFAANSLNIVYGCHRLLPALSRPG